MRSDNSGSFADLLAHLLGTDPAAAEWPREFAIAGALVPLPALFDPHNALLVIYGVRSAGFEVAELQVCLDAGQTAPELCSRVLVYAQDSETEAWEALGFRNEGTISAYWPDGSAAALWAKGWGARASATPDGCSAEPIAEAPTETALPSGWTCRPALPDDAVAITALTREVFVNYPIPADPGSLRYNLASEEVHGRLVHNQVQDLVAYAAWEFSPTTGSAELTDCATAPGFRGWGVMSYLVGRLEEDLADVFGDLACHSLAREDEKGMQQVLARRGWCRSGKLANHFREGSGWVSACVWNGPAGHLKKRS